MMKSWMRNGVAASAVVLTTIVAACGGSTGPTSPTAPTVPTAPTPAPGPGTPPATSTLVLPATYSMDTIRTCAPSSGCGTRTVPAALFTINSTGVVQSQMRGHIRLNADRTFYFESVQRTDANGIKGEDLGLIGTGVFTFTDSLISLKTDAGGVAPGTMTINTDGTLTRFYDIPIQPPFQPQTIAVTETYRLVR